MSVGACVGKAETPYRERPVRGRERSGSEDRLGLRSGLR
jgi:hypothetical protein